MNEASAASASGTTSTASAIPRCIGLFAISLAAYASAASTAQAQTGDSVIQGRVIAADTKASLPEAIVTVRSPALQGEQTVVTDRSGFYRVPNLPPGLYSVRVDKENHSSFEQLQIELRSSTTLRVDGVLVPETTKGEEIVLTTDAPTVDVGSSSVSTTISNEMTRRVPIARPGTKGGGVRSFESVALVAPEAKSDLYGTSMAGTTSPENRYIIDGLAVNNTAYGIGSTPLTTEFIKEVNVVTGGYLPEYGRSTGGVLNAVTKTGSNDWFSGAWWNISPVEGSRERLFREGSTIFWQQPELSYETDAGAEVGGPILRDKLWFYVGVDVARSMYGVERSLYQTDLDPAGMAIKNAAGESQRQLIPGTTLDFDASAQTVQALGKLTFTPIRTHSFTFTSIAAPVRSGGGDDRHFGINPENGRPDPAVTANGRYESLAYRYEKDLFDNILKWTATTVGSRLIFDTTLGWHHETSDNLPWDGSQPGATSGQASISGVAFRRNNPGLHSIRDFETVPDGFCAEPNPMAAVACPVTTYQDISPGFIRTSTLDRYQVKSMVTWVAEALGHHVVKGGVEFELTGYEIGKAYAGGNLYRESTTGTTFADYRNFGYLVAPDSPVYLDVQRTDTKAYTIGGFLQDSWSVMDKVTVNLGLRYDAQYLYNTFDKLGLALPNQWSPRLGFIYDPTQKGRSRLFGSFARYYQNVPLDMADRALSGEPQIQASRAVTPACDPRNPVQARTSCRDPANVRTIGTPEDPNQKFAILSGGTVPVDPDIKPPSVDEMVLGAEYEVIQSRVGVTYTRRRLNEIIEDMSRDEATTYFLGNPGRGIAKDFPKAVRDYDAITAHFSRSFQGNWLAQASYTLSWLRGNYSGLFRPESGQLDPNITSDFDLQSLLPNRDGPLPGDRRHQLKLFGAYDWRLGERHNIQTGLGYRSSSGAPTNYLGSHPIYGPDEVFVLERGSGPRLPWTHSVDVQAGYGFYFSQDFNLSAMVAVYNVFNFQETTQIEQRFTNSDVLPVVGATSPGALTQVKTPDGTPFNPVTERHPNFGRAVRTQEPLLLQLGVRATF